MKIQSLSIIVPAYNEELTLGLFVHCMQSLVESMPFETKMIIVNDGSSDQTEQVLNRLAKTYSFIKAVHHSQNQMIGGAFLSGLEAADTSHVILVPVDNPLEKSVMRRFVDAAENADIVCGYRLQRKGYSWWMQILSYCYWYLCKILFGAGLQDWTWICLYDRAKINGIHLKFKGIALLPEILAKAVTKKMTVAEVFCPMIARTTGQATVSKISRIVHLFFETLRLWRHVRFEKW